jgi:hypothetical protein
MGIKEELEAEAKKVAEKAGDYLKQKEEELLADARARLDDEVADLERKAADKVSEVFHRETDRLSERASGAIGKKK